MGRPSVLKTQEELQREKKGKSLFEARRYRCQHCNLYFLYEEVDMQRFSPDKGLCARCLVYEKRFDFDIPPCFGKSYNGTNPLCMKVCAIQPGCLIHFADGKVTDWELEFRKEERRMHYNGRFHTSYRRDMVRLLRLIGKAIHIQDLVPLLSKFSGGRFNPVHPNNAARLLTLVRDTHQIVSLEGGYFIWRGVWDPDVHTGLPIKHKPKPKPLPVAILALQEENKHLRKFLSDEQKIQFFGKIPLDDEIESLPIVADHAQILAENQKDEKSKEETLPSGDSGDDELESLLRRKELDEEIAALLDSEDFHD
jgi:hypothetical protein